MFKLLFASSLYCVWLCYWSLNSKLTGRFLLLNILLLGAEHWEAFFLFSSNSFLSVLIQYLHSYTVVIWWGNWHYCSHLILWIACQKKIFVMFCIWHQECNILKIVNCCQSRENYILCLYLIAKMGDWGIYIHLLIFRAHFFRVKFWLPVPLVLYPHFGGLSIFFMTYWQR